MLAAALTWGTVGPAQLRSGTTAGPGALGALRQLVGGAVLHERLTVPAAAGSLVLLAGLAVVALPRRGGRTRPRPGALGKPGTARRGRGRRAHRWPVTGSRRLLVAPPPTPRNPMSAVAPTAVVFAASAPPPERPWWALVLLASGAVALATGVALGMMHRRAGGPPSRHAGPPREMAPAQAWLHQSAAAAAPPAPAPRTLPAALIALAVAGVVALGLGAWFVASPPGGGGTANVAATAPAASAAPLAASARPTRAAKLGPRFVSSDPDLCLATESAGVGSPLIVSTCNGSRTQRWLPNGDGTIRLGRYCMDLANAETADGTIVQAAECNDNEAQQFDVEDGRIVSVLADKCVDIVGEKLAPGAGVTIRPCDETGRRSWRYVR
ncbi:RICIN domain-containing protein [Spirilliplanes yamanashiensis]|uniref:Ricin B lectin domain-containing protein n=1 Tax=Spirilliplanes yamanashiensis TaxID=42233 RepID=A0A8J4DJB8_9ACTN|nr:ricin-type beta-trefoil lectin domain protein [Spirilliplanes yamanashiensis]MDP9817275.1 drug/metabolite transporter (DMT)-like permease [Spirilliplanes yamanashiensis]GIJ03073.1 hypothetical protein Sya03_24250 [Spirilliplanes yamanashiensis]